LIPKRQGLLFAVSAPSGAGKTTLCREMALSISHLTYSVSYTTRSARPGEVHGRDYCFVSKEEFQEKIHRNEFAEWAEVHGHLYGTHAGSIRQVLEQGVDVLLDVDGQGAAALKKLFPEGVFVYILPPSLGALRDRLYERGLDATDEIQRRLNVARREIQNLDQYSYLIVNDDFKKARRELESIILSERVRLRLPDTESIKRNFLTD
jgi:guanylate kinase